MPKRHRVKLTADEMSLFRAYMVKYFQDDFVIDNPSHQFSPIKRGGKMRENPNRIGIGTELAVYKKMGKSVAERLMERKIYGSDEGWDITINGLNLDIKGHPRIYSSQMINIQDKPSDGYIIVNRVSEDEFDIMGWVLKKELPWMGSLHKMGENRGHGFFYRCDTWEIATNNLRDFDSV